MFDLVMGVWRDVLQWVLDIWKTFEVFEGITIWNVITTAFVSFGVVSMILVQFGGSGISKGVTDIRDSYENAKNDRYNNSYEKYKENRERASSYEKRYKSEKGSK